MNRLLQSNRDTLEVYFPGVRPASEIAKVEVVPTGLPSLDNIVLGCGGLPRGRSIEIYAPTSVGKTTLVLNLIANYQKQGLDCAFDDREGTFPGPEYTDGIGLDRDQLLMIDSASGNDCLYKARLAIATNIFDLYCIDSVAAIMPDNASVVDDIKDLSMHEKLQRASLLTGFYNHLRSGYQIGTPGASKKDGSINLKDLIESDKVYIVDGNENKYIHKLQDKITTLIMINHQKKKPGISYGDDSSTPGGDSGKFDATIRLRMTHKKQSKKKDKFGSPEFKVVEIRADKNKIAPPFRSAQFQLWRTGLITEMDTVINDSELEDLQENPEEMGSGGVKLKRK